MKYIWLALFLIFLVPALRSAQTTKNPALPLNDPQTEQELKKIAQELLDAVAPGNKAVWDRYLAENCVITDEEGNTLTKAQILDQLRPLPSGYTGTIRIAEAQVRSYGSVAVITHHDIENEEIFGQKIIAEYRTTDTYLKRDNQWQMIASQVMVIPSERKTIKVNPEIYSVFVGEYELAPSVTYTVTRDGDKLIGQRTGRSKEELLPANETTFFRKGTVRGEKIFVKDENGRVFQMIDRRDNNDLIWKKIK
jgi:hypothetical protein